ncbi:MAG: alpha-amylase family glycosyl hydrolase, partial [Ignavibacteriales bacterium]
QKGSDRTWFGSKDELIDLINQIHQNKMQVYADLVINHSSGGDAAEENPLDKKMRWTNFNPMSGKFKRDWKCFHPSLYERWDKETFGDMPDLCHRNPYVYSQLLECARWMIEEIGFDGFRFDCVKGYGGWMVRAIQELRGLRDNKVISPFGVGECWDSERTIQDWLDETNSWSDNTACAFDFPLRDRLLSLCHDSGFSLRALANDGVLVSKRPLEAVTFVENHDTARSNPVIQDKMLAYAYILTHEGYPCVFWQDYYNYGLEQKNYQSGIAALVRIHEDYAGGSTNILYADDNLYVMQRNGYASQRGLIFVLNKRLGWNGAMVHTQWRNTNFKPMAWRGKDNLDIPDIKRSDDYGNCDLWAPPRGYAVYIPEV